MKIEGFKDTIDWYNKNAPQYAESAEKAPPVEFIKKFMTKLPLHPKILDAGCGSGRDARIFKELGAKVIGLDISEGLLGEARARCPNVDFIYGDMTSMPFTDRSFDGLWSHASLVHLEKTEDVQKAVKEFNRVLVDEGILYIHTKEQTGERKTDVVADSLSGHDRFFRYYTPAELETVLKENGFSDIKTSLVPDLYGRKEVSWILIFAKKTKI